MKRDPAFTIPYSGKFLRVHIFAISFQSPQQIFSWVLLFNARKSSMLGNHTIDIRRERDGKRYINSIDDPRFSQCFLLYFLQPMLLASTRL